jgi:hypothetical protein
MQSTNDTEASKAVSELGQTPPKCWDQEEHRILVLEAQVRALGGTP